MNDPSPNERKAWSRVTEMFGSQQATLDERSTGLVRSNPGRLSVVLARAKFLARLITSQRRIMEFGPIEPLASRVLAEFAASYTGVDVDRRFVASANSVFAPFGLDFRHDISAERRSYGCVITLDFNDSLAQFGSSSAELLDRICELLTDDGVAAVVSNAATFGELRGALAARFAAVVSFRCCGEAIVADQDPKSDDVILLAVHPRRGTKTENDLVKVDDRNSASRPIGGPALDVGPHMCHWLHKSPRRLLHSMSYYRFAAELIGSGTSGAERRVLDIGCGEGWGTWLLADRCGLAVGIDFDAPAVEVAARNFSTPRIRFTCGDFFETPVETYDAVVNFDCIEHILPDNVDAFWRRIAAHLPSDGIAIIGTPSLASDAHANPTTRAGHVNLYTGDRLEAEMARYFRTVLLFSANDELVHTGFRPLAHYYIAVGIGPRESPPK